MDKILALYAAFNKLDTEHEIDAFDTACRLALSDSEYKQLMLLIY